MNFLLTLKVGEVKKKKVGRHLLAVLHWAARVNEEILVERGDINVNDFFFNPQKLKINLVSVLTAA